MLQKGMKPENVKGGFENTGLWPVNASKPITRILSRKTSIQRPIAPAIQELLPAENEFAEMEGFVAYVGQRYEEGHSSPTRNTVSITPSPLPMLQGVS